MGAVVARDDDRGPVAVNSGEGGNGKAAKKKDDESIYLEVQSKLDDITPTLSSFRYVLPSLTKQKDEMARQTLVLLGENSTFDGYLEIGSSGRYLDYLEEKVNILSS